MKTSWPENLKPEEDVWLEEHSKNLKNFENHNKDWVALTAYWKMLQNFIDGKKLNDSEKKNVEMIKKDSIRQASIIMNDGTLNADWKNTALAKLFWTFQENKDAFPQEQNQAQQTQDIEKDKSENFLKDLLEIIWENRLASEVRNQNIAKWIKNQDIPPAQSWRNPPEIPEWLML